MARMEFASMNGALGGVPATGDTFFQLGLMYAAGSDVEVDLVAAHQWFNLAAMQGNAEAVRLRREVAEQMSEEDIAAAQRAARAWVRSH